MVTSRITKFIPPVEEETQIPQEVLNIQWLLTDNWWKLLIDRIDNTINNSILEISKPMPLWLTDEQEKIYHNDMEKIKFKIQCYRELKELPELLIREYQNDTIMVNYNEKV